MDGDKGKEQFDKFLASDVAVNRSDFKNFDFESTQTRWVLENIKMNVKSNQRCEKFAFSSLLSVMNKNSLKDNLDFSALEAVRVWYDELIA